MEFTNIDYILAAQAASIDEYEQWLHSEMPGMDKNGKAILIFVKGDEEISIFFQSFTEKIRAIEFMDFMVQKYGLIKGDKFEAEAVLSKKIADLMIAGSESWDFEKYILLKTREYLEDCIWIDTEEYLSRNREAILNMPLYKKKRIPWAVVKSTAITEAGKGIYIKSLENESGFELKASDDIYIMIGLKGEVYDIKKEKFDNSYEATEEKLDVFEAMMDSIPEVMLTESGEYVSIDEKAALCYPRNKYGIYAGLLNKRTRVYTKGREGDYYVGRAGDILAIREDDLSDMYIIQSSVFDKTYDLA